jgi:protein required for attachment to host cells
MMDYFILVASSEFASLLSLKDHQFALIQELEHKEAREKVSQLVSDRPGRTFAIASSERHSLNEGQDIQKHEREKFAKELGRLCKKQHEDHPEKSLVIVASPKFLGDLRHTFEHIPGLSVAREFPKEIPPTWPMQRKFEYIEGLLELD